MKSLRGLLSTRRRKLLAVIIFAILLLTLIGLFALFNASNSDEEGSSNEVISVDLEKGLRTKYLADEEAVLESDEASGEEKLSALMSLTTLALEDNEYDKALDYATRAYETEGLSAPKRLSTGMNLVNTYGLRGEFEEGISVITKLEADNEIMALEQVNFYIDRYKSAYKENRMPEPVNCKDPQKPGDCPII